MLVFDAALAALQQDLTSRSWGQSIFCSIPCHEIYTMAYICGAQQQQTTLADSERAYYGPLTISTHLCISCCCNHMQQHTAHTWCCDLPDNFVVVALQIAWVVDCDGLTVEIIGCTWHVTGVVTYTESNTIISSKIWLQMHVFYLTQSSHKSKRSVPP